jgi:hypothetical protein
MKLAEIEFWKCGKGDSTAPKKVMAPPISSIDDIASK